MQVDFFSNPNKTSSNKSKFGLCDDVASENCPKNPAYIDEYDNDKWTAIITNTDQKIAIFYPIDNCIEIRRPNGEMDNRCDGLLKYDGNLIFVE